jgi:hypothetical protein
MNFLDVTTAKRADAALLDRLVDGELGQAERQQLLRQLDREPDGWKRCALAFLEAQAWGETIAAGAAEGVARMPAAVPPSRPRSLPRLAALAAAVAVAFGVGFVSRGAGSWDRGTGVRTVAQRPQPAAPVGEALVPRPVASATPPAGAAASVPEYLRRQMERQGYRVQGDRKMVSVALQDGRKVAVPVETVSLRYVGQRIH